VTLNVLIAAWGVVGALVLALIWKAG